MIEVDITIFMKDGRQIQMGKVLLDVHGVIHFNERQAEVMKDYQPELIHHILAKIK